MNPKERFEAVLKGETPDRLPWAPRMDIWYKAHKTQGTLPEQFRDLSLREIEKSLGLVSHARGGTVFTVRLKEVEVQEQITGDEITTTYITPHGEVSEKYRINRRAEHGGGPFEKGRLETLFKGDEDYRVLEHIVQNTEYEPTYDLFLEYEKQIGTDGYPSAGCGSDPFFETIYDIMGYNRAYYEIHDNPEKFESLLALTCDKRDEMLKVILDSPAKLIRYGSHFDSQMTPPTLFNRYIKPHLKRFSGALHERGKIHAIHADADSSQLLQCFSQSGIDMAECFCTAPMARCTLEDAVDAWGESLIIWGGVPSAILYPAAFSDRDFKRFMKDVFELLARKKARVILGVADNLMPEGDIGRIRMISEMVEEFSPL